MNKTPVRRSVRAGLAALILSVAVWNGCGQDDDSSILFSKNPRTDTGTGPYPARLSEIAADTTLQVTFKTASSSVLLAGALPSGFAARPYFKFGTLPDSAAVPPDSILSATVTVMVKDRYGADVATLTLHEAPSAWSPDSLDYATSPTGPSMSEFSPEVASVDTTTRLTAPLSPARFAEWRHDASSNFGLHLGSTSQDALIRLYSVATDPGEQTPSLMIRFVADADTDSVTVKATADDYAFQRPSPPSDPQRLEIAGGWALRTLIRFDSDSLRALIPEGATVNRARLVLTVVESSGLLGTVSLAAYTVTSSWGESAADSVLTTSSAAATASYSTGADSLVFEIAGLVRNWIAGNVANYGLQIRSTSETVDLAHLSVASRQNPDVSIRPRLDLAYTLPPGGRP
jgi:hypothetical protein